MISCVTNSDDEKWCDTQENSTEDSGWGYCNDNCIPTVTHPDLCTQDLGLYMCGEVCKEIWEPCYGACSDYRGVQWNLAQTACHSVCGEDSYKCGNLCTWNRWDCKCGDVTLSDELKMRLKNGHGDDPKAGMFFDAIFNDVEAQQKTDADSNSV